MNALIACEGCRRHVWVEDARCPFCGMAVKAAAPAAPRPRRIVGPITRAAIFYGASALSACSQGSSETAPPSTEAHATETHATEGEAPGVMMPSSVEAPVEAPAEADAPGPAEPEPLAHAVGPVEVEPEPADVSRRERAHAEGRKGAHQRRRQQQQQTVRRVQQWQRDVRIAQPYGAPPGDFPIV